MWYLFWAVEGTISVDVKTKHSLWKGVTSMMPTQVRLVESLSVVGFGIWMPTRNLIDACYLVIKHFEFKSKTEPQKQQQQQQKKTWNQTTSLYADVCKEIYVDSVV